MFFLIGHFLAGQLWAAEPGLAVSAGPNRVPPPTPPPVEVRKEAGMVPLPQALEGLTVYSIGSPTDEEQLYVELLNRARINPAQEAERLRNTADPNILQAYDYFGVDLDLMASQISGLAATAPLSIDAKLMAAARLHSGDMLANAFQGHTGSDGSTPSSRVSAQGYGWSMLGENVFASADSVEYGHAGFEVDWGYGTGGMQSPPGHRLNIHNSGFREIGVGVVLGSNGGVGPQLVTQDFASRSALLPFITGVAYYDLNGNGFYDLGEGLGGVEVTVTGSSSYAITARSGGYSVPAPANNSVTVRFAAAGIPDFSQAVAVGSANVKVDYVPLYTPPVTVGPDPVWVGLSNRFTFSAVGGMDGYEWERIKRSPFTAVEGAENGLTNVTASVSAGYQVVVSDVHASGTKSFHLAHPAPEDQVLRLKRLLRPGTNSTLNFASRLGLANPGQVATVQVSTNEGDGWLTVWSRPGTGSSGQSSFANISVPLGAMAGTFLEIQFVYDYTSGNYYYQTSTGAGWYIDNIAVTQAEELTAPVLAEADSSAACFFDFVPDALGDYALRVRGRAANRLFLWGPAFLTQAVSALPQVRFRAGPVLAGNRATIEFEVSGGTASAFTVEIASSPAGPWSRDMSATIQTLISGSRFQANASVGDGHSAFYRIMATSQ
jgi:hypothetical protein